MKVTYNWLKDFVEIKISPQALAEKLTMAGLEVTSLEEVAGDFVFEIEVTSNRPDWLSVVGIAREVAAITGAKPNLSSVVRRPSSVKSKAQFSIKIEDTKDCPLYIARVASGVKVGPSPDWLKERLELVGCRSVNNVVDITNYILFVTGEPLHAFDLDKLSSPDTIIVRRAKPGEKITTIDGQERTLNPGILVIADRQKPVAIAGVMGGKNTEVTENTRNVLLEAAVFNPVIIRRGRQAQGLQSESAYRFERGVAIGTAEISSCAAIKLIQELSGGSFILVKCAGKAKAKAREINLETDTVNRVLGIDITGPRIKKILESLEFKVRPKGKNSYSVGVPGWRLDVSAQIDLIEEVARIYGFDNLPTTVPKVKPCVTIRDTRDLVSKIKNILVGLGLDEVITYSLVDKDLPKGFEEKGVEAVEILNPLSKEQEILRTGLIPSLARCVAFNLNQKQEYIAIFEIANAFVKANPSPKEELRLGVALCGTKSLLLEQGLIKDETGFLHLKGILEVLFERLGVKDHSFNPESQAASFTVEIGKEKIGKIMRLSKFTLDRLDIKNKSVFALEISLEKLLAHAELEKKFILPAKYPGITRDISFVLKEDIAVKDILSALEEKARPLLREIKVADYYKGKQIPAGFRGLTVSCIYRSDERTLTEAEINPAHAALCNTLTERFGAKMR